MSSSETKQHAVDLSFASVLASLEQLPPTASLPLELTTFLTLPSTLKTLSNPHRPFPPNSSINLKSTGKLTLPPATTSGKGKDIKLDQFAQENVILVSERFDLDQVLAFKALRNAKRRLVNEAEQDENEDGFVGWKGELGEHEWDIVTAFVFEERMAVLDMVAFLLRCRDDTSHACSTFSSTYLPQVLSPSLPSTLLQSFISRSSTSLPKPVLNSGPHTQFWSEMLLREEKALLEICFLIWYSPDMEEGGAAVVKSGGAATGKADDTPALTLVIQAIKETNWGYKHELPMNAHTLTLLLAISDLLLLLAIESMNLESLATSTLQLLPIPSEKALPRSSLFNATNLSEINSSMEEIVQMENNGERGAVMLLGWAFVLERITESLKPGGGQDRGQGGVHSDYYEVAGSLLGIDATSPPASRGAIATAPKTKQPLFQIYASHALSSSFFPTLISILSRPLLRNTPEPNQFGYVSVLVGLVSSIPLLIRLSFLDQDQYSGLIAAFEILYQNESARMFCRSFWERLNEGSAGEDGESKIVELALSRFPVQFGPFLKLMKALCIGASRREDEDNADGKEELNSITCARIAFAYLNNLPSMTVIVPSSSGSNNPLPLPYSTWEGPDNITTYLKVEREMRVSKRLVIKPGTKGRVVSNKGMRPLVVAWEEQSWSAWKLFADVLDNFIGAPSTTSTEVDVFESSTTALGSLPVEWDSEEDKLRDVIAVVDLVRLVCHNDPEKAKEYIATMQAGSNTHFVQTVFTLLEKASSATHLTTELVTALIKLIAALLPVFPGIVWTFLRSTSYLFPISSPTSSTTWTQDPHNHIILRTEKSQGQYGVTLALLDLVHALVLEDQYTSSAAPKELIDVKKNVLLKALEWIKGEIWSAHASWRYSVLEEKYQIGLKILKVYSLILEETVLASHVGGPTGTGNVVSDFLIDNFLVRSTITQLAPLLAPIGLGPDPISLLRKGNRYADAQAGEDLVCSSLAILQTLLRLSQRLRSSTPTLLEKVTLAHGTGDNQYLDTPKTDLITKLASFIVAPVHPSTAVLAARVFKVLTISSAGWAPRPPSLTALLGGSEAARSWVTAMLGVVAEHKGEGDDEALQIAVWDLFSSILEAQPSLAVLVVTGRPYPYATEDQSKGKDRATEPTPTTNGAIAPTPPPSRLLIPRPALDVAMDLLGDHRALWDEQPALLSAILRFLDYAWQHRTDFGEAFESFRSKAAPSVWDPVITIAFETPGLQPDGDDLVPRYCQRLTSKSHAVRILALDVQAALSRPKPDQAVGPKALLKVLADRKLLMKATAAAIMTGCSPDLHSGIFDLLRESFPEVPLESLRLPPSMHPLDETRHFGSDYLYSLPMLRRKLLGFHLDGESMVDMDAMDDVIAQTANLNLNFSIVEAQMSNTRSWRQLLEFVLPLVRKDAAASATIMSVAELVAGEVAEENRDGQIVLTVHEERLAILLTMVEVIQGVSSNKVPETLVLLLGEVARICSNPTMPPLESVARRTTPLFHRTLFRIVFFLFRKVNAFMGVGKGLFSAEQVTNLNVATETILRLMITATRDITVLARTGKSLEVEEDLSLSVSVIAQILHSPFIPPASHWLIHCHEVDLFRCAFEVLVYMEQLDGRILYAQHILDLCLTMASSTPQAAEQMALEGLMTALTNNALTAAAEAGAIGVVSVDGYRTPQHHLWTSMLALVVSLITALGESTQFVQQEVTGFVRLYAAQITFSLGWNSDTALTFPGLEEMLNAASLMYGVVHHSGANAQVATLFADRALFLLQEVVYAILHPNHLSALIEPVTPEERAWNEKDKPVAEEDAGKRAAVERVTLALLQLARILVDSLLAYTASFATLMKEREEWSLDKAILTPSSAVSSSEKASLGTLFDLATFCLDTLRQPPQSPKDAPPLISTIPLPSYSPELLVQNAEHTLEAVMVLGTTQLGLWLYRPDTRPAIRREITVELAGDLLSMLDRTANLQKGEQKTPAKGVKGGVSLQLIKVLRTFVSEEIAVDW